MGGLETDGLFLEIIYKRLLSTFCETSHTNRTFWKVKHRKDNLTSWYYINFHLQKLSFCFLVKENNVKSTLKNLGYDFNVKWGCEIKEEMDGDVNSTPWFGQFHWKKILLDLSAWFPSNSSTWTFIIINTFIFIYCTGLWLIWSIVDLCTIKYVWKDYEL